MEILTVISGLSDSVGGCDVEGAVATDGYGDQHSL
jgi:hypothetical protein